MSERSFVMVKPDGVAAGLTGEIVSRIERRGLSILALEKTVMERRSPRSTTASIVSGRSSASWWTSSPRVRS